MSILNILATVEIETECPSIAGDSLRKRVIVQSTYVLDMERKDGTYQIRISTHTLKTLYASIVCTTCYW